MDCAEMEPSVTSALVGFSVCGSGRVSDLTDTFELHRFAKTSGLEKLAASLPSRLACEESRTQEKADVRAGKPLLTSLKE